MRHKEERRVARKEAMISNIRELLNYHGRATALPSTTERQFHQVIEELRQSINQARMSIYYIDGELEELDRAEYRGPGS